jgi:hypothetical protein
LSVVVAVTAAYGNGDEVLLLICRCSLSVIREKYQIINTWYQVIKSDLTLTFFLFRKRFLILERVIEEAQII